MYVIGQPSRIDHIGLHMSRMSVCEFVYFVCGHEKKSYDEVCNIGISRS